MLLTKKYRELCVCIRKMNKLECWRNMGNNIESTLFKNR